MNVYIPLIANLLLSIIVFVIAIKVYSIYKRKYIKWFLIALFFIPLLFIYSFFEMFLLPYYSVLLYPLFIIVIEVSAIMAQRNLLFSLRTEESKEYKILLREDIALIRDFEKIANYLIGRISPLIGVKSVENVLENCIEKYPILAGCYIGIDEKLKTMLLERNIEKLKGNRMKKICECFTYLIERLIELYSAFIPYNEIVEGLSKEIGRVDKRLTKYFIPMALFKLVVEPITRKYKAEDLKELRINVDIEGIYINRKGGIEIHRIYRYTKIEEKFLNFLKRCLPLFHKTIDDVEKQITENFRKLPSNIKGEIYRYEFVKLLPKGILEEEKIALASKEKLIEELAERKKKLEEAYARLAEAKLDRMKSKFIDIIAHELKTPLTAIKTYTDLLRKEKLGKLNKLQKEKLDKMAKNIERLTKLIDDMLQIPSIDAKELELRKERFYIKEIIDEIVEELEEVAQEKEQKIEIKIEDNLTVMGDKKLIEKAIKNIVTNAIKYTPKNGIICIEATRDGNMAHIMIKDTGKGIKKEELEKIFEPFYTGEGGGVGLGLTIAKNIIESHGGKIWAENKGYKGKGSTFHILLRRGRT